MSGESEVEGHSFSPGGSPPSRAVGTPRIGRRLRAARARRGLELEEVERRLRIRARHLRALESERFDDLPGEAYARAFLREYADFLGLHGDSLVRALDERLGLTADPAPEAAEPHLPERSFWIYADRISRHLPAHMPIVALALAIATFAFLSWRLNGNPTPPAAVAVTHATAPDPESLRTAGVEPSQRSPRRPAPAQPHLARLVLAPTSGDCWLLVRDGSADGRILYEGTLHPGGSLRFTRKQLWIRTGAPWNLAVRLNGRAVDGLPAQPGNVIATTTGLQPA